jgi:HSP20 family molecular chaperone IbpA
VFSEAEEVLIVVDLGGFTRGEISLTRTPLQYVVRAARGQQRFEEIIDLPVNVDVERAHEHLVNGVLEIVLPRQRPRPPATPEGPKLKGSKSHTRLEGTQR